MTEFAKGVLKNDSFQLGEPCSIGSPSASGAGVAVATPTADANGPTARLIQQDETHAVIEVVCTCGKTIQIQCNYAPTAG